MTSPSTNTTSRISVSSRSTITTTRCPSAASPSPPQQQQPRDSSFPPPLSEAPWCQSPPVNPRPEQVLNRSGIEIIETIDDNATVVPPPCLPMTAPATTTTTTPQLAMRSGGALRAYWAT